jgi:hypothetical protein
MLLAIAAVVAGPLLRYRASDAQERQGSLQQEIAQVEQQVDNIEADALATIPTADREILAVPREVASANIFNALRWLTASRGQFGPQRLFDALANLPDRLDSGSGRHYPAGMPSRARIQSPAKTKRWRVSIIRKRGEVLGHVEAPTRETAERTAVKAFDLDDEQRKRMVVQER